MLLVLGVRRTILGPGNSAQRGQSGGRGRAFNRRGLGRFLRPVLPEAPQGGKKSTVREESYKAACSTVDFVARRRQINHRRYEQGPTLGAFGVVFNLTAGSRPGSALGRQRLSGWDR